ncbi:MAG: hypothetical protein PHY76_01785 [Patescibacteria group bacterium]|nr:hypothetical protein [Patescibacteria group bacterium]
MFNEQKIFQFEKKEKISEAREKLLRLEKEGNFVFHGSLDVLEELSPRQAYNKNKPDGEPAVFATPYADVAIFRALINTRYINENASNSFDLENDSLKFKASKNLLDHAKEITGKVYVLNKKDFVDFIGMECRSPQSVEPVEVVDVSFEDLPTGIELITI